MPVRYGIIGCGPGSPAGYIPQCVASADSKLIAICDPAQRHAAELADRFGGEVYADHNAMLASADIDAVVVAGPSELHAAHSIDCLRAGKHVLCDEPMATTRAEARAVIQTASTSGKLLVIGLSQRLTPAHVKAKEILEHGRLGAVLSFRGSYAYRKSELPELHLEQSGEAGSKQNASREIGLRNADALSWLLGKDFVEVGGFVAAPVSSRMHPADTELDHNVYLTLKSSTGIVGSLTVYQSDSIAHENLIVLYCQNGVMVIGADPSYQIVVTYSNGACELHTVGDSAPNLCRESENAIASFTQAILTKNQPKLDAEEGYKSLDLILTSMEAGRAGRILKIGAAA